MSPGECSPRRYSSEDEADHNLKMASDEIIGKPFTNDDNDVNNDNSI